MLSLSFPLLAAILTAVPTLAQLDRLRATVPGSLHQCEDTSIFLFDSGASRPVDVLFLPSANVPASQRSGTLTLESASRLSPAFSLSGIDTPDASAHNFILGLPAGAVVELFAFLPDGSGKALGLTRTIQTPLPSATNCLGSGNRVADPVATPAPDSSKGNPPAIVTPTPVVAPTTTAEPTPTATFATPSIVESSEEPSSTDEPAPSPTAAPAPAPVAPTQAAAAPATTAPTDNEEASPSAPSPAQATSPASSAAFALVMSAVTTCFATVGASNSTGNATVAATLTSLSGCLADLQVNPNAMAPASNSSTSPVTESSSTSSIAKAAPTVATPPAAAPVPAASPAPVAAAPDTLTDTPSGDLQSFRATVPGSLHQCDNSSIVFFDADSNGPISVLFIPSANVPNALRSESSSLEAVRRLGPAMSLQVAEMPNAAPYPFSVNIPAGEVVELFGFFPDGSGKPLSLTRTIMTPLPSATNCLANTPSRRNLGAGVVTAVPKLVRKLRQ